MVCVAVCPVIRACVKNVLYGNKPNQNQVQLMPVPWTPVSPGNFVLRFCLEEGVSDAKGVEGTQLKQSLTILIHFRYSTRTEAGGPWIVVCTHSGIKVTQENKSFGAGNGQNCCCKILVELIFCVRSGGQYWGVHTDQGEWAFGGVQASIYQQTAYNLERILQLRHSHRRRHNTGSSSWVGLQGLFPTVGAGGGVIPYISHKGMCSPIGYGFCAISV